MRLSGWSLRQNFQESLKVKAICVTNFANSVCNLYTYNALLVYDEHTFKHTFGHTFKLCIQFFFACCVTVS